MLSPRPFPSGASLVTLSWWDKSDISWLSLGVFVEFSLYSMILSGKFYVLKILLKF
jgi:hypothetical protein